MRPSSFGPSNHAPQPVPVAGFLTDIVDTVTSGVKSAAADLGITEALPTKTDLQSAVKTAATARLQQSVTKALGVKTPATVGPAATNVQGQAVDHTGAPVATAPIGGGSWIDKSVTWAKEHPIAATAIVAVTVWGIREVWKRR